jgi:hypothetical protein
MVNLSDRSSPLGLSFVIVGMQHLVDGQSGVTPLVLLPVVIAVERNDIICPGNSRPSLILPNILVVRRASRQDIAACPLML